MRPCDVDTYLARIGLARPSAPNVAALARLQMGHLLSVPFENLDIPRGRALSLDPADLFDKIVVRRRGGFCYELNHLFSLLLGALGFEVELVSARVYGASGEPGPPFDHLALRVRCNEPWLVDVGFGDGFREPLRWEIDRVQTQSFRDFRLESGDSGVLLSGRAPGSQWEPVYVVDPTSRSIREFEPMFLYHQTSPASPFPHKRVCTRATPDGRISLLNDRRVEISGPERTESPVDEADRARVLLADFGIRLDP